MRHTAIAALLALLLTPIAAHADTIGALSGRVVDFGTQLPLANVEVRAISPSVQRVTRTDSHGNFVFLDLPPGPYEVSFAHALYAGNVFTALFIPAGVEIHVQVALKRAFYIIDGFRPIPVGWLVRPGVTADVYRFNARVPGMGSPGSAFGFFPAVPGLTFGSAPRMMR